MLNTYKGAVTSFETRSAFGRTKPIPHRVWYTVSALDEADAAQRIALRASRDGYGFGGVSDITCITRRITQATVILPDRDPLRYQSSSAAMTDVYAWGRLQYPNISPITTQKPLLTTITFDEAKVFIVSDSADHG